MLNKKPLKPSYMVGIFLSSILTLFFAVHKLPPFVWILNQWIASLQQYSTYTTAKECTKLAFMTLYVIILIVIQSSIYCFHKYSGVKSNSNSKYNRIIYYFIDRFDLFPTHLMILGFFLIIIGFDMTITNFFQNSVTYLSVSKLEKGQNTFSKYVELVDGRILFEQSWLTTNEKQDKVYYIPVVVNNKKPSVFLSLTEEESKSLPPDILGMIFKHTIGDKEDFESHFTKTTGVQSPYYLLYVGKKPIPFEFLFALRFFSGIGLIIFLIGLVWLRIISPSKITSYHDERF